MKRKTLLFSFLAVLSGGTAFADTSQVVTVNGSVVDKNVISLTFSGDNVTMTFDDESSQTEDMSLINIAFSYDATGIRDIQASESAKDKKVYSISGQYLGKTTDRLGKGIYIVNGKKIVIK